MKPIVIKACLGLGIFILIAPMLYITAVVVGLKAHVKEDRIVFGSLRIQDAICAYDQKHGYLPAKL